MKSICLVIERVERLSVVNIVCHLLLNAVMLVAVLVARIILNTCRGVKWCLYTFSSVKRLYRAELRAMYGAGEWMERHPVVAGCLLTIWTLGCLYRALMY